MSGRLAAVKPAANTPTTLFTIPTNLLVSLTISACNQGTIPDQISIQICDGIAVDEDYIEYNANLAQGGVLERSGLVLKPSQHIVVTTQKGQTSFVTWGVAENL